jgi:AraC-like DNA-binding protein
LVDGGHVILYIGPAFPIAAHRNSVTVLAFGLDDEFEVAEHLDGPPGTGRRVRSAVIPAGQWHRLHTPASTLAFLYLDAGDQSWKKLAASGTPGPRACAIGIADEEKALNVLRRLHAQPRAQRADFIALRACLGIEAPRMDRRIEASLARLRSDPGLTHRVSEHAAQAGLSVSQFQRLFTESTGLPWRRWRLWQRVGSAVREIVAGASLTDAAHTAGFSSGAHFSDTFKAMFGMPPSNLSAIDLTWTVIDVRPSSP